MTKTLPVPSLHGNVETVEMAACVYLRRGTWVLHLSLQAFDGRAASPKQVPEAALRQDQGMHRWP